MLHHSELYLALEDSVHTSQYLFTGVVTNSYITVLARKIILEVDAMPN